MKNKLIVLVMFALIVGMVFAFQGSRRSQALDNTSCTVGSFEATVYQGPDVGLQLLGQLALQAGPDNSLSGTLTSQKDGSSVKVVGQVNGRAINLAFDAGKAKDSDAETYIYGAGTLWNAFPDCSGAMGGPLVGPQAGDSGQWGDCGSRPGVPCIPPPPAK